MYINAYSTSSAVDRLNQVNAGLTSVRRTLTDAPTNNLPHRARPATLTTALSGRDTRSVAAAGSFANSLSGLLSSVGTAADSVSESQLTLRTIRTQLETILSVAMKARDNRVLAGKQSQGQLIIDHAVAAIDRLTGRQKRLSSEAAAGGRAELILPGALGGIAEDNATFRVSGTLGEAIVSGSKGESLADVALGINELTLQTGVTAGVDGNNLVFQSVGVGSNAAITVLPVADGTTVSGVNRGQLVDVVLNSILPNSRETIAGTVSSAEAAELSYDGNAASLNFDSGTFSIAGNLGSGSFTFNAAESLAGLASLVNQQTESTGITAAVSDGRLVFQSVEIGIAAQISVRLDYYQRSVSGQNPSQVAAFEVLALQPGSNHTIAVDITTSAEQAEQTYAGQNGRVTNLATFELVGNLGSETLSIQRGELLTDAAARVNQLTVTTGVTASVDGDNLVLNSVDYGSDTGFSLEVTSLVDVVGVNHNQIVDFQVDSIAPNSNQTISGSVVDAAEQAQLTYSGGGLGSVVKDDATLDVAGNLGSASITVTRDESLADVADRINQQSAATGVTATVVNNDLLLNSVDYGSNAQAFVEVTSGKFVVRGGTNSGDGKIDYGSDVKAKINGVNHFGNGNQLLYSQGSGSFTLDFVAGFDGSFDTIYVASTLGADHLTDGEHANALGVNNDQFVNFHVDLAVPDSVQAVSGRVVDAAERAQLKYSGGAGSVVKDDAILDVAGNLGSASLTVTRDESLADVADRINQQIAATGVTATVVNNDLFLNSVDYGSSAQAFVEVTSGKFDVSGGANSGDGKIDYGSDVKANINGVNHFGDGNQLSFSDAAGSFSVEFAASFDGDFDTVSVSSINNAFRLSGGNGDGTANGVDAQAVINGQSLTASGNRLSFSDPLGSYTLDLATGFVGTLDPISVASTPAAYSIDGGNGDGTAQGRDAEAVINGQTLIGNANQFAYDSETGSLS